MIIFLFSFCWNSQQHLTQCWHYLNVETPSKFLSYLITCTGTSCGFPTLRPSVGFSHSREISTYSRLVWSTWPSRHNVTWRCLIPRFLQCGQPCFSWLNTRSGSTPPLGFPRVLALDSLAVLFLC